MPSNKDLEKKSFFSKEQIQTLVELFKKKNAAYEDFKTKLEDLQLVDQNYAKLEDDFNALSDSFPRQDNGELDKSFVRHFQIIAMLNLGTLYRMTDQYFNSFVKQVDARLESEGQ